MWRRGANNCSGQESGARMVCKVLRQGLVPRNQPKKDAWDQSRSERKDGKIKEAERQAKKRSGKDWFHQTLPRQVGRRNQKLGRQCTSPTTGRQPCSMPPQCDMREPSSCTSRRIVWVVSLFFFLFFFLSSSDGGGWRMGQYRCYLEEESVCLGFLFHHSTKVGKGGCEVESGKDGSIDDACDMCKCCLSSSTDPRQRFRTLKTLEAVLKCWLSPSRCATTNSGLDPRHARR